MCLTALSIGFETISYRNECTTHCISLNEEMIVFFCCGYVGTIQAIEFDRSKKSSIIWRRVWLSFFFHESSLLKTIAVVSMLNRVPRFRYERSTEPCVADDVAMCVEVCLHHSHAIVRRAPLARNSMSDMPHIACTDHQQAICRQSLEARAPRTKAQVETNPRVATHLYG